MQEYTVNIMAHDLLISTSLCFIQDGVNDEENALDLDELFRDCYFGDFPLPPLGGADAAAPQAAAAAAPPKRKADEMAAASKSMYATTGGVTAASAAGSEAEPEPACLCT